MSDKAVEVFDVLRRRAKEALRNNTALVMTAEEFRICALDNLASVSIERDKELKEAIVHPEQFKGYLMGCPVVIEG